MVDAESVSKPATKPRCTAPLALLVGWFLVLGSQAFAQPPANDNFASAEVLEIGASGSNVDATRESGERVHWAGDDSGSVWYNFTAPTSGTYKISTCGSNLNTVLAVYTGNAVNALTLVGNDDDDSPTCPVPSPLAS